MEQTENDLSVEAEQCFESGDIFYSLDHKKSLRDAVKALVQNQSGLAVIADNESLLTHYSRMLISRLRKLNKYQMDIFSPTDTKALLDRFNEMLASMTMEEARKKPGNSKPITLLVVNDANAVDQEQWALLFRLLIDFPGVNVRLILFLNKTNWPNYEDVLQPINRQLHRWELTLPSVSEATALLVAAKTKGYEAQTKQLLKTIGFDDILTDRKKPESADMDDDIEVARAMLLEQTKAAKQKQADAGDLSKPDALPWWKRIFIVLVLMLLSAVAMAYLYPDFRAVIVDLVNSQYSAPEDKTEPEKPLSDVVSPDLTERTVDEVDVADDQSITQETDTITETLRDAIQEETDVTTSSAIPNKEVAAIVVEEIAERASTAVESEQVESLVDLSEPSTEQQVLTNLPKDTFFVQHSVVTGKNRVENYFEKYPALKSAWVLPITANGEKAYAIISGPFVSREQATEFTEDPLVPADFWIWESTQLRRWCERNESCQLAVN
jgi:hypothetical protein